MEITRQMNIQPVTLVGKYVRLEPLSMSHASDLAKVGLEKDIWRYMRYGRVETVEEMRRWVGYILDLQAKGNDLPFAVIHLASMRAVGCTRYLDIDRSNRSLEIGGTWYGKTYQGTLVNSECKYLLFKHAFETLEAVRVWLKTDLRNLRSQRAIEKLGAVKEGVLRNHMILPEGTIRDSVVYSLVPREWPQVKANLEAKLAYE